MKSKLRNAAMSLSFVLALGGAASWGAPPPNNDVSDADGNTAGGTNALINNTTGKYNTATGSGALQFNTSGTDNTATGLSALFNNTTGYANTATGETALLSNTV